MSDWKSTIRTDGIGLHQKTLVEVYGSERVLIEVHRGVLAYGEQEIRVGTTFGTAVIEGLELRLCCMSRSQIVIRGRIESIRLEEAQ